MREEFCLMKRQRRTDRRMENQFDNFYVVLRRSTGFMSATIIITMTAIMWWNGEHSPALLLSSAVLPQLATVERLSTGQTEPETPHRDQRTGIIVFQALDPADVTCKLTLASWPADAQVVCGCWGVTLSLLLPEEETLADLKKLMQLYHHSYQHTANQMFFWKPSIHVKWRLAYHLSLHWLSKTNHKSTELSDRWHHPLIQAKSTHSAAWPAFVSA